jgi:CheY-like chemotaxis protein
LDLLRESDRPLVVLLDLLMPNLSGVDLLHRVAHESGVADRHAFILFSASQEVSAPHRAVLRAAPAAVHPPRAVRPR